MATQPNALTADDVFDLPLPNGVQAYECVDGLAVPIMAPSFLHARVTAEVGHHLSNYVERAGLTGTVCVGAGSVLGLRRDRERMRIPDVAYFSKEKVDAIADVERVIRVVPDLAIEIDLTSAKKPHGQQRIVDYVEAGVRLVWAIDVHTQTAQVYHPDGSARLVRQHEALDGEDVLPGFTLPMSELFRA